MQINKDQKKIILKDPSHSSPMPSTTEYRHRLVLIAFSFPKIRKSSLKPSALNETELEGGRRAVDARCQLTESGEWHTELKSNLKTDNSKPLQVPSITFTLTGRTSTTFWSGFNIFFLYKFTEKHWGAWTSNMTEHTASAPSAVFCKSKGGRKQICTQNNYRKRSHQN